MSQETPKKKKKEKGQFGGTRQKKVRSVLLGHAYFADTCKISFAWNEGLFPSR